MITLNDYSILIYIFLERTDFMETWLLTVKSYTDAMRGKRFLEGLNIKGSVEKISGRGGCTYAVRIKGDPNRASRLLGTVGIDVIKIISGSKR